MGEDLEAPEFTVDELLGLIEGGELDTDELRSAVSELGLLEDEKAVPTLIEAARHQAVEVRSSAAISLGFFTDPEAIQAVEVLRDDPSKLVRLGARSARGVQKKQGSASSRRLRKAEEINQRHLRRKREMQEHFLGAFKELLERADGQVAEVVCQPALHGGQAVRQIRLDPSDSDACQVDLKFGSTSLFCVFGRNGASAERVSIRSSKMKKLVRTFEEAIIDVVDNGYVEFIRENEDRLEAVGQAGDLRASSDNLPAAFSELPKFDDLPAEGWTKVTYSAYR